MNSEFDELNQALAWWESFVPSLETELQHYHDYLNDLDSRSRFEKILDGISDLDAKKNAILRLKTIDDLFLRVTDSCVEGVPSGPVHPPDKEWFRFRKPRHVGNDWE